MRKTLGSVLAVLGAAATLVSPWQGWYGGRHGSTYKFWEVFGNGITTAKSGVTDSLFLVFLVAAVIARRRSAVPLAGAGAARRHRRVRVRRPVDGAPGPGGRRARRQRRQPGPGRRRRLGAGRRRPDDRRRSPRAAPGRCGTAPVPVAASGRPAARPDPGDRARRDPGDAAAPRTTPRRARPRRSPRRRPGCSACTRTSRRTRPRRSRRPSRRRAEPAGLRHHARPRAAASAALAEHRAADRVRPCPARTHRSTCCSSASAWSGPAASGRWRRVC